VRSGWKKGYEELSKEERIAWSRNVPPKWVGVERSEATLRWLWDNGISACAGDAPAWETITNIREPPEVPVLGTILLHEVMLGGWGMPIGEYFDLERLSEQCFQTKRYSFFLTSMPLNIPGGIASPPNVMAVF